MPSISRELAAWAAGLGHADLPETVRDRARGLTLHALSSALLGQAMTDPVRALRMMREEEPNGGPATVLVHGARLTRGGAALVNSEMIYAGGKWDTFRMLTHPGCAIMPAALAVAETEGASGEEFLTAVAAGYEVMERLAGDFIPTVMARGFHAGPVFAIFGAAVAAAKLMCLDAEAIHGAIAQCVNLASGNLEGARSGGKSLREGGAVRNALLAVAMARNGVKGGETTIEGEAGFYHAYAGNNLGRLTYAFNAENRTDLAAITEGLGQDWLMLETLYRIYSTAGYNIAYVDVTAALCAENGIDHREIERIEAVANWLETEYPSPAFPSRGRGAAVGSSHYYAAYGAVRRGFPLNKNLPEGVAGAPDPAGVLELMQRVRITPSHRHGLFAPEITIVMKDGRTFRKAATGREFMWDFEEEARRIREIIPDIPLSAPRFEELIAACRDLDRLDRADRLIALTLA